MKHSDRLARAYHLLSGSALIYCMFGSFRFIHLLYNYHYTTNMACNMY